MTSEAASSSSQLRAALPPKRTRVEEDVQTNETMKDLNEMKDELGRMRKTLFSTEEDRETGRGLQQETRRGDKTLEARK